MKMRLSISLPSVLLVLTFLSLLKSPENSKLWTEIQPGLCLGIFQAPVKAEHGDSKIRIIKINPDSFDIDLYCSSEYDNKPRTLRQWAEEFGLIAAINAGMFATDLSTSIGFLKSHTHVNNPKINSSYKTILACQPLEKNIVPVQIIDLTCSSFSEWENKYDSFLQSIRMISCRQNNVWSQQENEWSISAVAIDRKGYMLLIHSQSPYSVHDFNNMLLELPLNLYNAMYLEGGPQAGLYFSAGGLSGDYNGNSFVNLFLTGSGSNGWTVPNIIGIRKKVGD
ncbi:MAG: hypothetical protein EH225_02490 [Calditrichaeota bacterium]|nr:phosphodiester glycosidase family protein [Calditrichota bacterium]RQW07052.1 MAG: hypothetical protein EH225_02490 [Calditrichota bacterium]